MFEDLLECLHLGLPKHQGMEPHSMLHGRAHGLGFGGNTEPVLDKRNMGCFKSWTTRVGCHKVENACSKPNKPNNLKHWFTWSCSTLEYYSVPKKFGSGHAKNQPGVQHVRFMRPKVKRVVVRPSNMFNWWPIPVQYRHQITWLTIRLMEIFQDDFYSWLGKKV